MKKITLCIIFWCILVNALFAQSEKYWIFFTDKDAQHYDYKQHLSEATIAKRQLLNLPLVQYTDIPLRQHYIQTVASQGATIVIASKWLNAVSATIDAQTIEKIKANPFVEKVIPFRSVFQVQKIKPIEKTLYSKALEQIEGATLVDKNLNGEGILVGVIDAGFYEAHKSDYLTDLFKENRILGTKDWVNPKKKEYFSEMETDSDGHGTTVLEMIAGYKNPDERLGLATKANFYLARTDDGDKEFRGEEDYWIAAMEWMDSVGVRLINTSLGYSDAFDEDKDDYTPAQIDGKTAVITKAADIAVQEKGLMLVVSAGNEGSDTSWEILSAPADAQGVLSVGANNASGMKMGYSSIGGEKLSYLKPDVTAYSLSGTSFSAPIITGFVACLMQKNPQLSNKQLIEIIQKSAILYPYGNNYVGYGVPKAKRALVLIEKESLPITASRQTVKGNVFIFKPQNVDARVFIFHKKNEKIVSKQDYLMGKRNKYKIKRNAEIRFSTIVAGEEVVEIEWQE